MWLYSPVCVGPGQKPWRPVFSQGGWYNCLKVQAWWKYEQILTKATIVTLQNPWNIDRKMEGWTEKDNTYLHSDKWHYYNLESVSHILGPWSLLGTCNTSYSLSWDTVHCSDSSPRTSSSRSSYDCRTLVCRCTLVSDYRKSRFPR